MKAGKRQRNSTNAKAVSFVLYAMVFAICVSAPAQQPTNVPRIGYLIVSPLSSFSARVEGFRQGLRELGYVEGKNIVIEWRSADGNLDRVPALAVELVKLKVDVIVTAGQGATRPAKAATSTIPIVMSQDADPVANGFVASLAHPGGNITGLSTLAPERSGKQLEILKETVPRLSRVAVIGTSTRAEDAKALDETKRAAGAMKVQIQYLDLLKSDEIEAAFRAASKGGAEALLWHASGSVARQNRTRVVELAAKSRRPAIYGQRYWAEGGGLMTYGVNFADLDRRLAVYVDKILKGTKPADIPVEQPTKFELVINLKTAKQLGITIPQWVLVKADKVIR
jgi:ABC-type uncharacterized transport system substrate-binding protein